MNFSKHKQIIDKGRVYAAGQRSSSQMYLYSLLAFFHSDGPLGTPLNGKLLGNLQELTNRNFYFHLFWLGLTKLANIATPSFFSFNSLLELIFF